MKKESLIICDTNICIFRTLALVEPKIYNDDLEKAKKVIDDLTNNNFKCKIVLADITVQELKNNSILFGCISDFCTRKLHYKYADFKIRKIFQQAKKSIEKFINKYSVPEISGIKEYNQHLPSVDSLYSKHPEKLRQITNNKTKYLRPFDKAKKLVLRPCNLPEENDRLILCQAIELKAQTENSVCIFSDDYDFLEFRQEIKQEFGIEVIGIDEQIVLDNESN